MHSKIYTFLISFLRRYLRVGYIREVKGQIQPIHPFPNPFPYPIFCVYFIIEFDVHDLATY